MALDFPNSPTNGQLYTSNNVTWEYDSSTSTWDVKYDGVAGTTRVALLKDQKNFGVNGGIFTKDAWRDRDLTVKEDPQNFVTFPRRKFSKFRHFPRRQMFLNVLKRSLCTRKWNKTTQFNF